MEFSRHGSFIGAGESIAGHRHEMSDFGADEFLVLVVSIAVTFTRGIDYYYGLIRAGSVMGKLRQRWPLYFIPLVGLLILLPILLYLAAKPVRTNPALIFLFMLLGAAWMLVAPKLFCFLGLGLDEDAIAQRNPAAVIASSGALLASLLTYAGGNIGEGDSIWQTIFSSLLATAGMVLGWLLLECFSRVSLAITEERDVASGWRLCGYLIASGLICGRAVAGDWQSAGETLDDFAKFGWPVLLMTAIAAFVERKLQPSLQQPAPNPKTRGLLPAALYVLFAIAFLLWLGKWK